MSTALGFQYRLYTLIPLNQALVFRWPVPASSTRFSSPPSNSSRNELMPYPIQSSNQLNRPPCSASTGLFLLVCSYVHHNFSPNSRMDLNYCDYLRGLVSFGSNFPSPIRCSKFLRWYNGKFPNIAQRCSRASRPAFLRLALGYEISAGARGIAICIFHASVWHCIEGFHCLRV